MKLKNILLVVNDLERSKRFYRQLFGLCTALDGEETVMLTEGLVLQEKKVWEETLGEKVLARNHAAELYFEEKDLEGFLKKLETYDDPVRLIQPLTILPYGQKMLRLYDPDENLIEVREPL